MTPQNSLVIIGGALIVLALLLSIGGIYYVTVIRSDVASEQKGEHASVPSRAQQREEVVKKIVTSFLKSPGSAQFPDVVVKKILETEDHYIAFGEVDSQNGFGALLRNHFNILLIYKSGEITDVKNWEIDTLNLGDVVLIAEGKVQDPPLPITVELLESIRHVEELYRDMEQFYAEDVDLR